MLARRPICMPVLDLETDMPIIFDEMTVEIVQPAPAPPALAPAPVAALDADLSEQLAHALQLRAERLARLSAD